MQMEREAKVLVHCIAYCAKCGWADESKSHASKFAMKHAKNTGHQVSIEFGYSQHIVDYDKKESTQDVRKT